MKPSVAPDMYKEFCKFKDLNNLEFRRAWEILIDLMCAVYARNATKDLLVYQETSLPFFEAYFLSVKSQPFHDHLGPVFEKTVREFGRTKNAQHFTPNPIAQLVGDLYQLREEDFKDKENVSVYDPCVGFGALILGFIGSYKIKKPLMIVINDIDLLCCKASFVQICMALTVSPKLFKLYVTRGDALKFPRGEQLVLTANVHPIEVMEFRMMMELSKRESKK